MKCLASEKTAGNKEGGIVGQVLQQGRTGLPEFLLARQWARTLAACAAGSGLRADTAHGLSGIPGKPVAKFAVGTEQVEQLSDIGRGQGPLGYGHRCVFHYDGRRTTGWHGYLIHADVEWRIKPVFE